MLHCLRQTRFVVLCVYLLFCNNVTQNMYKTAQQFVNVFRVQRYTTAGYGLSILVHFWTRNFDVLPRKKSPTSFSMINHGVCNDTSQAIFLTLTTKQPTNATIWSLRRVAICRMAQSVELIWCFATLPTSATTIMPFITPPPSDAMHFLLLCN